MNEQFIVTIMEKFSALDISTLQLEINGSSITLKKHADSENIQVNSVVTAPKIIKNESNKMDSAVANSTTVLSNETVIKCPLVGTFYRAPSPDSPSYAEVGKTVKKGEPLCIIEAMKMMNTLEAEYDCVIEKIAVANGELVEFDQPLFMVKKI